MFDEFWDSFLDNLKGQCFRQLAKQTTLNVRLMCRPKVQRQQEQLHGYHENQALGPGVRRARPPQVCRPIVRVISLTGLNCSCRLTLTLNLKPIFERRRVWDYNTFATPALDVYVHHGSPEAEYVRVYDSKETRKYLSEQRNLMYVIYASRESLHHHVRPDEVPFSEPGSPPLLRQGGGLLPGCVLHQGGQPKDRRKTQLSPTLL